MKTPSSIDFLAIPRARLGFVLAELRAYADFFGDTLGFIAQPSIEKLSLPKEINSEVLVLL